MDARSRPDPAKQKTTMERTSDRELVVTRTIHARACLVFEAWTRPELFQRWWVPKSLDMTLLSCELDARVGGMYRLVFRHPSVAQPMAFFGRYTEVTPHSRLTWTNEEAGAAGPVTTATFQERDSKTLVVVRDVYPSKQALDDAIASGSTGALSETFDQLEELLATSQGS